MNILPTQRNPVLKQILKFVKNSIKSNQPGILEIYGDAGCGKSTILNQINEYFNYHTIFPQVNIINATPQFSFYDYLNSITQKEKTQSEIDDGKIIPVLNDLLLSSTNYKKDIQIIIIDESHLLSDEVIKQLKLVFDKYTGLPNYFLILSGRVQKLQANSIEVGAFTNDESNQIITNHLGQYWSDQNEDINKWIKNITGSWPFYLILFLEWGVQNGFLDKYNQMPLDALKQKTLPNSLLDAVKNRFQLLQLREIEKKVIEYISISFKPLSISELSILLNIAKDEIKSVCEILVNTNWLTNDYNLFHPLIQEIVSQECKNTEEIHLNLIDKINLSLKEKALHIQNLKNINDGYYPILISYVDELESEGLFYSAIQVLERFDKEKLNHEIQLKIAINLYHIGKHNQSKEILNKLFSLDFYKSNYKIYYYLGNIYYYQNKLDDAIKIIEQGIEILNDEYQVFKLKILLIHVYVNSKSKGEYTKLLNDLKPTENSNEKEALAYYVLVSSIHYKASLSINILNNNDRGIKLAKKTKNYSALAKLYTGIATYYEMADKIDKAIFHSNKAMKYAKLTFDFKLLTCVIQERGQHYIRNGKLGSGIIDLESAIQMNEYYDLKINVLNPNHALGASLRTLCHIQKYKKVYSDISELLKENENYGARLMLGLYYQGMKDFQNSLNSYSQLESQFKIQNNENLIAYTMSIFYPTLYLKDEKFAEENFNEGIEKLINLGTTIYTHAPFHKKGWTLLKNNRENLLTDHLNKWLDIIKDENKIPLDYYQPLMVINEIITGNRENALHRIRRFEDRFEGANINEYKKLYDWLINENTYPQFTPRYKIISELIDSITNVDKKLTNTKAINTSDKFLNFLIEWQHCIHYKRAFNKAVLSRFTLLHRQIDCITDCLSVWDIKVTWFDEYFDSMDYNIDIQLFGFSQISVNEKSIVKNRNKINKQVEILIFLILKGWKFHNGINKEQIALQIYADRKKENFKKIDNLNSHFTLLKKLLGEKYDQILHTEYNTIAFNWDFLDYKLDLDEFYHSFINAKDAIASNQVDKGITYLKHSINVYKGYLCENLYSDWIDEIRATFHNYYLDCLRHLEEYLPNDEFQIILNKEQIKFPKENLIDNFE